MQILYSTQKEQDPLIRTFCQKRTLSTPTPSIRFLLPTHQVNTPMLVLLLSLVSCYFPFQYPVIEGTSDNWVNDIVDQADKTVVFVMFIKKRSPQSKALFPEFQEAANQSIGMAKFVSLDVQAHPKIAHLYTVRNVPAFRILHPTGDDDFRGEKTAEGFMEAAYKHIPVKSQQIDSSWGPSENTPMSAIFLTNKNTIPPLWAAISCNFSNSRKVRIGHSKNSQFMSLFKVSTPSIVFVYREIVYYYNGPLTFMDLHRTIYSFLKNPKSNAAESGKLMELKNVKEFRNACRKTGKFCVFSSKNNDESDNLKMFSEIVKKYTHSPFKFFKCDKECPFNKMKEGFYIFHAKRPSLIFIEDADEISSTMDRVIDGTASWKSLSEEFEVYDEI